MVSCERADLKLSPREIQVFGDEARSTIAIPPPTLPRAEVIAEFLSAIQGERAPVHDGHWGLETMAACAALLESNARGAEVALAEMLPSG